ncbi:PilZ domain-containing protein [Pseudobacteroides cellulosolvens]|uniref:Type IV pilus assembly PilZ n=1 Tax=Pseudobacteroides cellulosolvens ATCC 35603 = DSM 2933 TaxID=398512 RepID=A0A0L6JWK6_9FIRM|nr:PilZ domain-containing protein [Pseudobacteroides cellulosolvens]KNY29812.1 type IV pilus assembly PilZ [Pseudobacteroides cellulosolvens ATCC 35603 = DSM 2933]
MELKTDKIVLVSHYSAVKPFRCDIIDASDSSITLRLTKQFSILNFLEGDPAVIMIKEQNNIINIGCNVTSIEPKANVIKLRIDTIEPGSELRLHERKPVSLYADVRKKGKDKKYIAIIKDISAFGLKIYSKETFYLNDVLQFDLYMQHKIIFLKAVILRKIPHKDFFEYGMRIEYESYETLNFIQTYIKNLSEDYS